MRRSEWYEQLGWNAGLRREPLAACPYSVAGGNVRPVRRRWRAFFRRWWIRGWEEAQTLLQIRRLKPFDVPVDDPRPLTRDPRRARYSGRDLRIHDE